MTDNYTAAAIYWIKTFTSKVKEKVKEWMWKVKLLELLNEYEETVNNNYHYYWWIDGDYISSKVNGTDHYLDKDEASIIIKSKEYGFIKWLVENDKIDFTKLDTPRFNQLVDNTLDSYYALLMLLAIQNDAIWFLISILK
jgi:hypothetical protein